MERQLLPLLSEESERNESGTFKVTRNKINKGRGCLEIPDIGDRHGFVFSLNGATRNFLWMREVGGTFRNFKMSGRYLSVQMRSVEEVNVSLATRRVI